MALENPKEYIPIDISYEFLKTNAKEFAKNFPEINVKAICADFNKINSLEKIVPKEKKILVSFLDQQSEIFVLTMLKTC